MKKGYSLIQVIIIVVITSIISGLTVGVIFFNGKSNSGGVSYTKLVADPNVKDFLDSYSEITTDYYEDVDKHLLVESAINGMMEYLDESYTSYLDENNADVLMESLNGTFDGVGLIINKNKVINVLASSPAKNAGILDGDIITNIDGIDVTSMNSTEITELIKNKDSISITLSRNENQYTVELKTTKLSTPQVQYNLIEDTKIGYIKINIFSKNVSKDTDNAIENLKKFGANKYIIDLRNNTGGYLEQALSTSSLFLKNKKVAYYLVEKNKKKPYYDNNKKYLTDPVVVLVNSKTASAAEILASALKDSYNAILVGEKTFGKGKVQHTHTLSTGSIVKYTSSKWLRPNGKCVDSKGIKPDYIVKNEELQELDTNGYMIVMGSKDNQLNQAIELLNK